MDTARGVCDCHVHVFDPQRFAYATPRRFTPGVADVACLRDHMARTGVARVVLVQPSVYGMAHDCLCDALAALAGAARGVAVLSAATSPAEVAALADAGVVGSRINLAVNHRSDPAEALARWQSIDHLMPSHWHLQWHVRLASLQALAGPIANSPRLHVIDHFGLPGPEHEVNTPAWRGLLELLDTGKVYVKLSAPYLAAQSKLASRVRSLLRHRPDRVLWGSNWPHTRGTARSDADDPHTVEPFGSHDDQAWLQQCAAWAGADADRLLRSNAASLYGFE